MSMTLVFATHNIEGLKAIKEAMWMVDPSGDYVFSDATVLQSQLDPLYANRARLSQQLTEFNS